MHKHIVLAVLVLSGCASPFGKAGKEAVNAALETPASQPAAPVAAPPAAVQQAVMDAVREAPPLAARPAGSEPRFNLTVNNAKASEVFMGMVTGTPYSMLVHPDVTGTLTLNLKNVTVPEAMEAVRALYGYEYEVQGKRIIVPSPALQTRIYHLNALAMQRKGTSDMRVVSGSVSTNGGGSSTSSSGSSSGSTSQSLETSSVQTSTDSKYWEEVGTSLKTLVGETGSVVVSPQSGIIIVKAAPASLYMVEKYLRASELVSTRQVMLEAKILEVQLNDGYQSGINWATLQHGGKTAIGVNGLNPDGTTTINLGGTVAQMLGGAIPGPAGSLFGLSFNDGDFGAVINLIKSQGAVHVLSSPRIATINNQKAVLKVGTDDFFVTEVTGGTAAALGVPATPPTVVVQPFFSGIALDVTPQIDDKDNITLHVRPSVSNVTEKEKDIRLGDLGNFVLPLASSSISETDSVVRLKDGQIVAIGGLMSQSFDDSKNRIPVLGDIPYLGELFGNTSQSRLKRELVVLIKTTLIRDNQDWNRDLEATQRRFQTYELPEFRP
ncbi:MAG: secretin N-terminal domain-containing protein [Gammaproteobacteria bacterium]|nr:secretin N-terminal domain-containing protein [Gammaproteobacteria bacterium]MBU1407891.1 secretin N-terminal domain-containing protein [Gammaproteobacteria bacterium]MBU1532004.1 secretin N-terminal domain-containing protein [Gammaproteobacteria bacterium]